MILAALLILSIRTSDPALLPVLREAATAWNRTLADFPQLGSIEWCEHEDCLFDAGEFLAMTTWEEKRAHITLNRYADWKRFSLEGTVAHELGHVMGLGHIDVARGPALMNPWGEVNRPTKLDWEVLHDKDSR